MTLSADHKEAVNKTIIQRLSGDGLPPHKDETPEDHKARVLGICEAQVERFSKHLTKMTAKAKSKGWGKRGEWPGDADRTYEDIAYYIKQFDKHKAIPAEQCVRMVKGFKAGMTSDEAIKAFG
ncbi:hypothetical protein [Paremcibacter congregatus]|uniref:hypothetical protein n=1 Tax=Paremcibacter congregatus TaxID=2043170 RepID=UPI0030EE9D07|tara:strand:- start:13679 stop:14047 length:369 start_codon:yes stop_codon:yes gene_type:complete